jgi:hypothetical protein
MPRLPPFALAQSEVPRRQQLLHLLFFLLLFGLPLFFFHLHLLSLPFFWDEHGQFIPTALDLLRTGAWVAHSTIPNIHPPGVEAFLALAYKLFGFSIPLTRGAMLLVASFGLLFTFLLAIELSRGTRGAPAFLPPILLLVSPLFYTQSMMAQLDMPAMVLTLLVLLLFLKRAYLWAAVASVPLVLVKETGLAVPFVLFLTLAWQRDWKRAAYFIAPAAALLGWLAVLHRATGYWMGDPGFAHYNVEYALNPVRMALSLARRIYYLFFAEFRWLGTAVLLWTASSSKVFRSREWSTVAAVAGLTVVLVSVLGGAELERYLLPVLPLFYIAVAIGISALNRKLALATTVALLVGLIVNLFWNPPYPFPYENNYAMVDFVSLEKLAGDFAESNLRDLRIATAWPYTSALSNPDFGFVKHRLRTVETNDFHATSIRKLPTGRFDALITYTRTWAPENGVIGWSMVQNFLRRFYEWEPDITPAQCEELGLREMVSWSLRGQTMTVYARKR